MIHEILSEDELKVVRWELVQVGDRVIVQGQNRGGTTWRVIEFSDRRIRRREAVGPGLGMDLDEKGRVKFEEED